MPHIDKLSDEWTEELVSYFWKNYDPHVIHERRYGNDHAGYVGFYDIDPTLNFYMQQYYRSRNIFLDGWNFYYQVLTGINRVTPHIDPKSQRTQGYLYLLDKGGDNVITKFWKLKDEYANEPQEEGKPIDDYKLDFVEEHKLDLGEWWFGDYTKIHSVENLERPRITIIPYLATVEYRECLYSAKVES